MKRGQVAEWSMAPDCKSGEARLHGGSTPPLPSIQNRRFLRNEQQKESIQSF